MSEDERSVPTTDDDEDADFDIMSLAPKTSVELLYINFNIRECILHDEVSDQEYEDTLGDMPKKY